MKQANGKKYLYIIIYNIAHIILYFCKILIYVKFAVCVVAQSCLTLCNPMDRSPPDSCPWDSPCKNTGVGCHFLLQKFANIYNINGILDVLQGCVSVSFPGGKDWNFTHHTRASKRGGSFLIRMKAPQRFVSSDLKFSSFFWMPQEKLVQHFGYGK